MSTFDLYNTEGTKVGTVVQPALFQTSVDEKLIHRYLVWVGTMLRHTIAHTKTRGDVSGGGKKPWRQKGTGRARVGSSRSPLWRTGGIVFGPRKEQTYATRMPRTERRKAFFSSLSAKANSNQILVLEDWKLDVPKTKSVVQLLSVLPLEAKTKVLHIHPEMEETLFKATRNLPCITSTTVARLNVNDIMNHDVILFTKESLSALEQHFTSSI